eukprot:672693-Amorphochlora_amoeboformis.AAC.1
MLIIYFILEGKVEGLMHMYNNSPPSYYNPTNTAQTASAPTPNPAAKTAAFATLTISAVPPAPPSATSMSYARAPTRSVLRTCSWPLPPFALMSPPTASRGLECATRASALASQTTALRISLTRLRVWSQCVTTWPAERERRGRDFSKGLLGWARRVGMDGCAR